MKALLPTLITFAYIDSELLRIHSSGVAPVPTNSTEAKERRERKKRELDEAFALGGGKGKEKASEDQTVLLFKFNDGELKSANGVGKFITKRFAYVCDTFIQYFRIKLLSFLP